MDEYGAIKAIECPEKRPHSDRVGVSSITGTHLVRGSTTPRIPPCRSSLEEFCQTSFVPLILASYSETVMHFRSLYLISRVIK